MVDVPTQDDFNALTDIVADLTNRVEALEQGTPPVPQGPTPDDVYIHDPSDGPIIDDNDNEYRIEDGNFTARGQQISKNGLLDPITQHVVTLGMSQRRVVQENEEGNWYADTVQGETTDTNWQQIADPTAPPAQPGKYIQVVNGRLYAPDGRQITLRGPNLRFLNWPDNQNTVMQHAIADFNTCKPLVDTFPGISAVRFDAFESMAQFGVAQPQAIYPYIDALVRQGIAVEVECHVYPTVLTGYDLDRVCGWYQEIAAHYIDEPLVIFGTQNEPAGSPDEEISRIYTAIRTTGNNTLIMMCLNGGWSFDGINPANYTRYHNVVWDLHPYGWLSNYSTDQNVVNQKLHDLIMQGASISSADGPIATIAGEFGACGYWNAGNGFMAEGMGVDNNWEQVLSAVHNSPELCGWFQWYWNTPETSTSNPIIDLLVLPPYDGSQVTQHGGVQLRAALQK